MVDSVRCPHPERLWREEVVLLSKPIELRVPVQHSGADELIEDADDERREEGEDDVVERERPGFVGDLTGKVVEERVLKYAMAERSAASRRETWEWELPRCGERMSAYVELGHVKDDILVERIWRIEETEDQLLGSKSSWRNGLKNKQRMSFDSRW
jgi:hypothetical protein